MAVMRIADIFPGFYHPFLPDFFQTELPRETSATCAECAMLSSAENQHGDFIGTYSAVSKCCTYYPEIPNFLVGAILAETDPAYEDGKNRIRSSIEKRVALTPHGLGRPRKYALLAKRTTDFFGKSRLLICPFYFREKAFLTAVILAKPGTTGGCEIGPQGAAALFAKIERADQEPAFPEKIGGSFTANARPVRLARIWIPYGNHPPSFQGIGVTDRGGVGRSTTAL